VLILGADEVRRLLPMEACIAAMEQAMRAVSTDRVDTPERSVSALPDGASYFFVMPGSMAGDGSRPPAYGAKLVSLHPRNPGEGRPAVQGFVSLFDGRTGRPEALIDGAGITRIRTAAASALATRELARREVRSHGIFGAGVQAASHLEAIACVRPIEEVRVWARNAERARAFAERESVRAGCRVVAVEAPDEAAACDVVSVVTNSPVPVLQGRWLRPGAHVNLVGAHEARHREADTDAVTCAEIYVDWRRGALSEAGDLLIPMSEGKLSASDIAGEIGEVLEGRAPGRGDERQVTLYKSLGVFAQDLFAAGEVLLAAKKEGAGTEVAFP
jgi:ornithine cyclodeaminase